MCDSLSNLRCTRPYLDFNVLTNVKVERKRICHHGHVTNMPHPFRDPSTLPFQSTSIRRTIIACYCAVILAATPLWWLTTSIQRLPLNVDINSLHPVSIPVHVVTSNAHRLDGEFRQAVQQSLSSKAWKAIDVKFFDSVFVRLLFGEPRKLIARQHLRTRWFRLIT